MADDQHPDNHFRMEAFAVAASSVSGGCELALIGGEARFRRLQLPGLFRTSQLVGVGALQRFCCGVAFLASVRIDSQRNGRTGMSKQPGNVGNCNPFML